MIEAWSCMSPGVDRSPRGWGDLVRSASPYTGPWPPMSLWQGTTDTTVKTVNLTELVDQWTDVHGADQTADRTDTVAGYPRQAYTDASGRTVVETYRITGMAHGQPVTTGCGRAGTYTPNKGICAAYHIGLWWGLT
jgi:poly(3-hydroxybutyrate) depolymerase